MRDTQPVMTLILGIAIAMVMFAMIVFLGPGIIPSQLDKCWLELQKEQKDCSIRKENGLTYIRDSRCVNPSQGLLLMADGDTGWYRLATLPQPAAPAAKEPNQ